MSDAYQALLADLQALDVDTVDPGVVAALATFWKNKEETALRERVTALEAIESAARAVRDNWRNPEHPNPGVAEDALIAALEATWPGRGAT